MGESVNGDSQTVTHQTNTNKMIRFIKNLLKRKPKPRKEAQRKHYSNHGCE